jgi:hypothetical protein
MSSFSDYLDKKSKRAGKKKVLLRSKVQQAFTGDHEHYFSKKDYAKDRNAARCKVCGKLLSEYVAEEQLKKKVSQLHARKDTGTPT